MKRIVINNSKKAKVATGVLEGLLIGAIGFAIHSFGKVRCLEGKMIAYEDATERLEELHEFVESKVKEHNDSTEEASE